MTGSLLLTSIVVLPGLTFAALGLGWLLGWNPREATVARLTSSCYSLSLVLTGLLAFHYFAGGAEPISAELGSWFEVGHHAFELVLLVDRLSLPLVGLSVVLVGVIGAFSRRYLHRDPGFHRFFTLLNLFGFGILLLFTAGSFDLLIGGWELVGLTSVLLIAFFQHRNEPVHNAIRVLAIYRACDIGLLTGVILLHRYHGSALYGHLFSGAWPRDVSLLSGHESTVVGGLLLLAAMGKAAQVPFSGWLPRAMEGPTPSSAVFYGALSVHAGAYLLLRAHPLLEASPAIRIAVVIVGVLTALYGTLTGRVAPDAKTSLAHASLTQLGLIFVEIGAEWHKPAPSHICGHATIRTLEFLRAPSMLHEFHHLHAAAGGELGATGSHYRYLLPAAARSWLYRFAMDGGHLDTLLDRLFVSPLLGLATFFCQMGRRKSRLLSYGGTPRSATSARLRRSTRNRLRSDPMASPPHV